MIKTLFQEYQNQLNFFFNRINFEKTAEIFQQIYKCMGMLIFTGIGKSGIIAEKLAKTMISTGTKAIYLPPMNALHGDIGIVDKKDILIFISKSGESEELINLLSFIREKGARSMAWVSNPNSRLFHLADLSISLPFQKELCPFDLAPTTSTAIQLIFGDVLSVALMKAKNFSLDEYALNHPGGQIGKMISLRVYDIMRKDQFLPICYPEEFLKHTLVELTRKGCGCLLVVNQKQRLQGIFTDGDLRRAIQENGSSSLEKPMKELINPNYLFIDQNILVVDALHRMEENPSKRVMMLPILEEEKLVGLVHMHDIIQTGLLPCNPHQSSDPSTLALK